MVGIKLILTFVDEKKGTFKFVTPSSPFLLSIKHLQAISYLRVFYILRYACTLIYGKNYLLCTHLICFLSAHYKHFSFLSDN